MRAQWADVSGCRANVRACRIPTRLSASVLAVVLSASAVHAGAASVDTLRERVLEFARANLGRRVGNGECAGLAYQALKAAGAMPRAAHGDPTPRDYVWGELVLRVEATPDGPKLTGSLADVKPGDIAQFSNVKFMKAHFAHHTAIVSDISPTHLGLYQQHVNGQKVVMQGGVRFDKLSAGWIRFYRPIPLYR